MKQNKKCLDGQQDEIKLNGITRGERIDKYKNEV
jgi:hypothetical protein